MDVTELSVYLSKRALAQKPVERLNKIATKLDRSVNYLVVQALLEFLDRHEK